MRPAVSVTRERWVLIALGGIVAITIAWWAAALWPLPATTPEWVVRARAACFGSTDSGLPNAGGWILLVGSPTSMVVALLIIAGGDLRNALSHLYGSLTGRAAVVGTVGVLSALGGAAAVRVLTAYGLTSSAALAAFAPLPADALPVLDTPAPVTPLYDQHGNLVDVRAFAGGPVLVTFTYGRCETVCPVIVQNVLQAQQRLDGEPVVLVLTLDPWRDTESRLPHIAERWGLRTNGYLLGGEVAAVEAALDAWGVERARDPRTGEISHPSLVYVLDSHGTIRFAVSGNTEQIVGAVRRLAGG